VVDARRRAPVGAHRGHARYCVVAIVELFAVYGMRLEWNGDMKLSGVSFETGGSEMRGWRRAVRPRRLWKPREPLPRPCLREPAARPAAVLDGLPRSGPRGRLRGDGDRDSLAGVGLAAAMEAAGGWRIRILHGGRGRAYTIEQRRDREAIAAYDIETGRELWAFAYPRCSTRSWAGPDRALRRCIARD